MVSATSRSLGLGPELVDELVDAGDRGRVREAVRVHARAVVFRAPRVFDGSARLAAGEDRDRLPLLSALPALRPVRGRAGAPASQPGLRAAGGAAWLTRPLSPAHRRPVCARHGRHHGAGRVQDRAACIAASRPAASALDLAILASEQHASAAALFTTNLAQAAPVHRVAQHHRADAAARPARSSSTAAAPMPAPASEGLAHARAMAAETAAARGLRAGRSARGEHRRDRRHAARSTASSRASVPRPARARPSERQRCRARHHDHRSVSQGTRGRRSRRRRGIVHGRRHGEGVGHDRAEHGDDAWLPDDRRAAYRRRCCAGRCRRSARDTFNAITVDGECSTNDSPVRPGLRRERRRRSTRSCYPALLDGLLAVSRELARRDRPRRRRRDQAHRRDRARRAHRRGRPPGGAHDRQFAAGQDRRARRRSELGPHRRCRGPLRRDLRHRSCHRARRRHPALRERAAARRRGAAGRRAPEGQDGADRGRASANRRGIGDDLDLRSDGRVRPDQRRVSGHEPVDRWPPPAAPAKDFLSILDLLDNGLVAIARRWPRS